LTRPAAQPPTIGATCSWPGHGLLVQGAGTWLWNGSVWTQIVTNNQPPTLYDMALDPVNGTVIALSTGLETWSFDGTDWQQLTTAWPLGGPPVTVARLAWEPVTQSMVAVAGWPVLSAPANCAFHLWNGSAWTLTSNGTRFGFSVNSLPGQGIFVSGGFQFPIQMGLTAVWNGSQWSLLGVGSYLETPAARVTSLSWYDTARGLLVVTSGLGTAPSTFSVHAFGTWYWDGATWAQPAFGRGPRFSAPRAYDSWRGLMLQFGGYFAYGYEHDQLWGRADDGIWTQLAGGPPKRYLHACTFDSWRGRLVIIGGGRREPGGGVDYSTDAHTTWEWDGAAWHATPSPSPPWSQQGFPVGRIDAAMAFDRVRGRSVLFGGRFGYGDPMSPNEQNDTWEWDGTTWTLATPQTMPPAVYSPRMWFDEGNGTCMLLANGLWSWDGSDWTSVPTPPVPNGGQVTGFDAAREVIVGSGYGPAGLGIYELHSGVWQQVSSSLPVPTGPFDLGRGAFASVDEVYWSDVGDASAGTIAPFGSGCIGTNGTPVLHGERPFRIASTRSVRLNNQPAGAPWFGMLGPDDDQWLGMTLPIDLSVLGAPQCMLRTGIVAHELVSGADWTITVPAALPLLGARVRLQAFVLDAGANALGATTSNGVRVKIGS